jgi:hypothetical protein
LDDLGGLVFSDDLSNLRVELLNAFVQIEDLPGEIRDELGGPSLSRQDGPLHAANHDRTFADIGRGAP